MSRLELFLLRPPQARLDGRLVEFDTRKATALLAYLACEARPHSREDLAALFWPEYDSARAFHNLRRTLWSLNKSLGKGWLESDTDVLSLENRSGLWLDVDIFRASIKPAAGQSNPQAGVESREDLAAAVELYRDDFMAGFSLPDCPAFDEWQFFQREGLRTELAGALERLVGSLVQAGDFSRAIPYARRWVELDPLNEPAHRALMYVYARSGQRSAALRQYEICVGTLEKELGVEPDPKTRELFEKIRDKLIVTGEEASSPAVESHDYLPHDLTPFIGRQEELADILRLLSDPGCRLLTLLGPGGIGKTRLALAAARRAGQSELGFEDGVFFVPLAPLASPEHIIPSLAQAVGFTFYNKEADLKQQLLDFLRARRTLLLLDNFEHLTGEESAGLLIDLLSSAAGVKLLVTSRARLNLRGEQVYPVVGMSTPETNRDWLDPHELTGYSSVRLFVESASRYQPGFELTDENVPMVARICQLMQGMPLGLELAAAWVALLPLNEIAAEIEQSLDFLETELQDVPERQRSLRAVFDATLSMLKEDQRAIFMKLSVFRGGFTRSAAQEVAAASLRDLAALAGYALVVRISSERYEIHELLRQYAEEALHQEPESWKVVRDLHSSYYMRFLCERGQEMGGPGHRSALEALDAEVENMRLAWARATEAGRYDLLDNALYGFFAYHNARGQYQEMYRQLSQNVEMLISSADDEIGQLLLAKCLISLAYFNPDTASGRPRGQLERALGLVRALQAERRLGIWYCMLAREYGFQLDPQEGLLMLRGSLVWLREAAEERELAFALQSLADVLYLVGDYPEAKTVIDEAIELCHKTGDVLNLADNYRILAVLFQSERNYVEAKQILLKQWEIYRSIDDRANSGYALFHVGTLALGMGEFSEAAEAFSQVKDQFSRLGVTSMAASALSWQAIAVMRGGDYSSAHDLRLQTLVMSDEPSQMTNKVWNLYEMGEIERVMGNLSQAEQRFEESVGIFPDQKMSLVQAFYHKGMGDLELARGDLAAAKEHFERSVAYARRDYNFWCGIYSTNGLGRVAVRQGMLEQARDYFREALVQANSGGDLTLVLVPLAGFAELLVAQGEFELAAELSSFVIGNQATWQEYRDIASAILADCTARIPASKLSSAQEHGSKRDLESWVVEFTAE